ncbi:hypothetical protein ACFODZ_01665 [Marinicella sediminis]|uniref:Uncharacterized protein n=1 Tax=Marinicella sediminis TaxID=1792834 RepID=A0ABV7J9P1_9GAMM|nr:hypothetical protein [Marinicella sediminis]
MMKTSVLLSALLISLGAVAQDSADVVKVTVDESKSRFTLICQPLLPVGELPENWVTLCNEQAHKLLQHESSYGNPVQVIKEPFGMAGSLAAQSFASLPEGVTPERITSTDLTLELQ